MNTYQKFILLLMFACWYRPAKAIEGSWMGLLEIDAENQLPIGLEVIRLADGKPGVNVSITAQNARYLANETARVTVDTVEVSLAGLPVTIEAKTTEDQQILSGQFKQGEVVLPLTFKRVDQIPEPSKPQTPAKTSTYIREEVVVYQAVDDIRLSGTLTQPMHDKKKPAVLLLPGSGPTDRDVYFGGHRLFLVLADHLTKAGYMVLRADKRGVYKSTGKFSTAGFNDLVRDAQVLLDYLQSHPAVKRNQIHVLGHSEGSLIAAQLAANNQGLKSVVSWAGPGVAAIDVMVTQDHDAAIAAGATKQQAEQVSVLSRRFYLTALAHDTVEARKKALNGFYAELDKKPDINKFFIRQGTLSVETASSDVFVQVLQLQPAAIWQQVDTTVFIVNGGKDQQVRPETNTQAIRQALHKGGNTKETIKIYPELNHMLQTAKSGEPSEYTALDETLAPRVLDDLVMWLDKL